jgi:hypothetical protein
MRLDRVRFAKHRPRPLNKSRTTLCALRSSSVRLGLPDAGSEIIIVTVYAGSKPRSRMESDGTSFRRCSAGWRSTGLYDWPTSGDSPPRKNSGSVSEMPSTGRSWRRAGTRRRRASLSTTAPTPLTPRCCSCPWWSSSGQEGSFQLRGEEIGRLTKLFGVDISRLSKLLGEHIKTNAATGLGNAESGEASAMGDATSRGNQPGAANKPRQKRVKMRSWPRRAVLVRVSFLPTRVLDACARSGAGVGR